MVVDACIELLRDHPPDLASHDLPVHWIAGLCESAKKYFADM